MDLRRMEQLTASFHRASGSGLGYCRLCCVGPICCLIVAVLDVGRVMCVLQNQGSSTKK